MTGQVTLDAGSYQGLQADQRFLTVIVPTVPSSAPEPTTWVLMLGGAGLAGEAVRSRRSQRLA